VIRLTLELYAKASAYFFSVLLVISRVCAVLTENSRLSFIAIWTGHRSSIQYVVLHTWKSFVHVVEDLLDLPNCPFSALFEVRAILYLIMLSEDIRKL
jgi:hypothetical protein